MKYKLQYIIIFFLLLANILLAINILLVKKQVEPEPTNPLPTATIQPTVISTPLISASPTIPTPLISPIQACSNECEDCMLYPVNKINSLKSDYIPNTQTSNGGTLVSDAQLNLRQLFEQAINEGLTLKIVSSFRSYQTQQSLFESYVQREMNRNNVDRERATEIANIYSAKPGHSEHQLGTTLDLTCSGCTAFANDAGNTKVYEFLRKNVAAHGFVVSYTEQNKHLTGYKAEPWHIRYIGKELALEYYSKSNELEGNYSLDLFLKAYCD